MRSYIISLMGLIWLFIAPSLSYASEQNPKPRTHQQILESGEVRMAVPYERVVYVDSKNQILGESPEIAKYLSRFLSKKYNKSIRATLVPVVPGKILQAIDNNEADFAVIFTREYDEQLKSRKYLRYSRPHLEESLIVTRAGTPPITSWLDLAGQDVCISRLKDASPLHEANKELIKAGKKPMNIYQEEFALDDEDFLQMLDAGLIENTYTYKWKADLWKPLFSDIQLNEQTLSQGGTPGDLIFRSENKELAKDILEFMSSPDLEEALDVYRRNEFVLRRNALKNPLTPEEWKRFESMRSYFKEYGNQNQIAPLFLASLGFQESMLNQKAVSHAGAIGVMQLLPKTGASLKVGNIHQLEPNIHAGAKYINSLLHELSIDDDLAGLDPGMERSFFATAAYNAGPENIRKARELAKEMGFDPNKWFSNVEMTTAKLYGNQTFLYVRNVYKYFVTYDLRQKNLSITEETIIPSETSH